MSYQVIARKWRPQAFSDVVGQNHITQTLLNALKNGRLPHALLFTGPRGTGKTSSARILAKALRCPNSQNFVPCGECTSCTEIATSSSMDVIEIDGASNNGVDSIRELRDTVAFMPAVGTYKVYIIDEVHMLTTNAFNALLKTLEEPPPHVIFIMATTEAHKIPQTILSRCQRFDFRRISTKQIMERLKLICDRDGAKADDDALWVIARQGDGSMRDAQSLLDQVISFADGALTKLNVVEILGLTDRSLLMDTLNALINRNSHEILHILARLSSSGTEPSLFAQELLESIRNLLLTKVSIGETTELLDLPDSELQGLQEMSARLPEEDIHLLFDMALKGAGDIARAQDPRIVLEVVMLRMAAAPKIIDLQSMMKSGFSAASSTPPAGGARQSNVKNYVPPVPLPTKPAPGHNRLAESQKVQEVPSGLAAMKAALDSKIIPKKSEPEKPAAVVVTPPAKASGANSDDRWVNFVDLVRNDDALFAAKIENLLFIREESKTLYFAIPSNLAFLKDQMSDMQVRKKLQGFIDSYWADGYSFQVATQTATGRETSGASAQGITQQKVQLAEDKLRVDIESHPLVKAATSAFNGQIKSITEIKRS